MAISSKSFTTALSRSVRRLFAPPLQAVSRTGKLVQTLWDAAQLQEQNRDYKRRLGEITIRLVEEGSLRNPAIDKIIARLKRNEDLLARLETNLAQEIKRPGSTRVEDSLDELEDKEVSASQSAVSGLKDERLGEV